MMKMCAEPTKFVRGKTTEDRRSPSPGGLPTQRTENQARAEGRLADSCWSLLSGRLWRVKDGVIPRVQAKTVGCEPSRYRGRPLRYTDPVAKETIRSMTAGATVVAVVVASVRFVVMLVVAGFPRLVMVMTL